MLAPSTGVPQSGWPQPQVPDRVVDVLSSRGALLWSSQWSLQKRSAGATSQLHGAYAHLWLVSELLVCMCPPMVC
jgi:hypothetical protein